MQIQQWEDKNLAHFSYAIMSNCEREIVLIDPARNPQPYLDFAAENNATITGIIETHPHADFVSSHLELSQLTEATIYTSSLVDAGYPHTAFDNGNSIELGKIKLTAINTPGHSPDSICVLLEREGKQHAVFTGDTLFIGDCGRPDLRENAGHQKNTRRELAANMYYSLRDKLLPLDDDTIVYPAHGAGTLCGKGLRKAASSTIKQEKESNWSLQPMEENEFIEKLLQDQPFVPAYFPFDVELNRQGAAPFQESIAAITISDAITNETDASRLDKNVMIIDARNEKYYKKSHLSNAINLMERTKFETWLGSLIPPGENFYLAAENDEQIKRLIERTAAIGYEPQIQSAFVLSYGTITEPVLDINLFKENIDNYTIVDIRNHSETAENKPFKNSLAIPLPELKSRLAEIPASKPVVVHCAGGYRSAAGSSIIQSALHGKTKVFDLGEAINQFM